MDTYTKLIQKRGRVEKMGEDVYVTVRIPRELANEIDQIINSSGLRCRTPAELVKCKK